MNDFDEMPTMNVIHLLALKDNQIFDLQRKVERLKASLYDISTHVGEFDSKDFFKDAYFEIKSLAKQALKGNQ